MAPLLGDLLEEMDDSAAPEAVDDGIDDEIIEIPAAADVTDLTRAAEDAAAAVRSSAADLRRDEAVEMGEGLSFPTPWVRPKTARIDGVDGKARFGPVDSAATPGLEGLRCQFLHQLRLFQSRIWPL